MTAMALLLAFFVKRATAAVDTSLAASTLGSKMTRGLKTPRRSI
jgi:hypothetical protein